MNRHEDAPARKSVKHPIPNKLIFLLIIFILGISSTVFYCVNKWNVLKPYFIETIEIEVEKEVEVIKWVEHIKMPTDMFITHLKPSLDPDVAVQIGNAVDVYSKEHQLPKKLILSIIFKESSFDLFAKSKAGAIGLMQVIPKYHEDKINAMGIEDNRKLYHIKNNIDLGCRVWKAYYDQSNKDLDETFHRYLSKNASEETKNLYKGSILETWARLEFMEFQYENGYAKEPKIERKRH